MIFPNPENEWINSCVPVFAGTQGKKQSGGVQESTGTCYIAKHIISYTKWVGNPESFAHILDPELLLDYSVRF